MIEIIVMAPFNKELKKLMKKYKTITADIRKLGDELI